MTALWGRDYDRRDLMNHVGRLQQIAGVRLVTLDDGVERGVRVLEFRTGTGFAFDVMVDRAMDVGRCEHAGRALGWQSATGFPGPWAYEPEGLGWLRGFGGGLVTTCGLEHALFMAEDTAAHFHYPAKETERFGLHGRISYRPARLTGYGERWDGDGSKRGSANRACASMTKSKTSATPARRTCFSITSTSAFRCSTRAPNCSRQRPTRRPAATTTWRDTPGSTGRARATSKK
jgi:hypothetical protein